MLPKYRFDIADARDDDQLRSCLAKNHMGEGISVSFRREPCYFDACKIQGDEYQVIKCTDSASGKIVGFGSRFILEANINGRPRRVGYLADLRAEPQVRNGMLLARGYKYLYELHKNQPMDFYYTLILSNNYKALDQLTSRRAGLPAYEHLGKILTPVIYLDMPKAEIKINGMRFATAQPDNLPAVLTFVQRLLAAKQFSPVYELEHFGSNRLRGLKAQDFYVAYRDDCIVGVIAAWDQGRFRQTHIEHYSAGMQLVLPVYNALSHIAPLKPMPKTGDKIPYLYFSLIAIENNNPDIFRGLLRYVYRQRRSGSWHYAIAGLHERDPLAECLTEYRRIPVSGELFSVHYPDAQNSVNQLDQRVPYIEIACA
jgi:hypothetical protein